MRFSRLDWCDPGMWRCQLKTCLGCYCCCWCWETCWSHFGVDLEADWSEVIKLNFCSDFEHNLIKICARACDKTLRSYLGKQNSTLGSVVPLAMFKTIRNDGFPFRVQINLYFVETKNHLDISRLKLIRGSLVGCISCDQMVPMTTVLLLSFSTLEHTNCCF